MPKERIASTTKFVDNTAPDGLSGTTVANLEVIDLSVGWNRTGGWVQLSSIPKNWDTTGDWTSFTLDRDEIDHLIRALRRAKRQVWPTEVLPGVYVYDDGAGAPTEGVDNGR